MDLSENILKLDPFPSLLLLCENKNSPHGPLVKCVFISGTVDLQGCGHRVHSGGVGMPGPCSEGLVQGRDGGDPQEPSLLGWGSLPFEVGICPGVSLHFPLCASWEPRFYLTDLKSLLIQTWRALGRSLRSLNLPFPLTICPLHDTSGVVPELL